ncbi:heat-inducible transcriptional repressor HrcA [Rhodoligotrophos ferricapiens]|uniref:heat-inducible transcriptional repressor HrcA n=1 Tax=Rhodoligotrophos ferricapiens TaxID=3069264 RepID=UPI00315D6DD6
MDHRLLGLADLDKRSREIFRQLVETYLSTGEPVGSRTISQMLPVNLSPASVRNVMSDLEAIGLISSPHTSAGRLPTELGLRFFVDALLEVGNIDEEERSQIEQRVTSHNRQRMDEVLTAATNMLSGLSQCAGVLVAPKFNVRLKHIEFVKLDNQRALVILVGEDGSVENRIITIPPGLPPSVLVAASNYLSTRFIGKTLSEIQKSMKTAVERLRQEIDELTATVVEQGLASWGSDDPEHEKTLIVRGRSNLLDDKDALQDLERIRSLLDDLESKRDLIRLLGLAEEGEGVRIFIGSENKLFSLSGSSIIIAPYRDAQERVVGVLGVIGPTRINYARIIPMVDYTAKVVSRLLS